MIKDNFAGRAKQIRESLEAACEAWDELKSKLDKYELDSDYCVICHGYGDPAFDCKDEEHAQLIVALTKWGL